MMHIKFERLYHGACAEENPPAAVRGGAEGQVEYLHPERTHVLTTTDGRAFSRAPLATSEGWRVTFTPSVQA